MTEHTPRATAQIDVAELRKLAEAACQNRVSLDDIMKHRKAATPAVILALLDRLEAAERATPQPAPAQGVSDALTVIRDLDKIGMEFGATLASLCTYAIKNCDYLRRDDVMRELIGWRQKWDKNAAARPDFAGMIRSAQTNGGGNG